MSEPKVTDPQAVLLGEIAEGSARYIRQWSRWDQIGLRLRDKGLVTRKWVYHYQFEYQITDLGRSVIDALTDTADD